MEPEIRDWISYNRDLGNPVTVWEIILKLTKLDESYKSKSVNALRKWCYKFLKRSMLTLRKSSHVGQSLPENAYQLITQFLQYVIRMRNKKFFELAGIANMDETPLYLNMPPERVVEKIGAKEVIVKTQGQESCRVSVLLTILGSGEKLPPMIIFKGKEMARIETQLNKLEVVKNKRIAIACQQKAWNDGPSMLRYTEMVWRPYAFF
jgi:hypothetical protein